MDVLPNDALDAMLTCLHDEHLSAKSREWLAERLGKQLAPLIGTPVTPERAAEIGRVIRRELDSLEVLTGQVTITDISRNPETNMINVSIALPLPEIDFSREV